MVIISEEIGQIITRLNEKGVSNQIISYAFQIKIDTIRKYFKKLNEKIQLPKKIRIQKHVLRAKDQRNIHSFLEEYPKASLSDILGGLELKCCKETLRKFMNQKNIILRKVKSEIVLTPEHKEKRLKFAKNMLKWSNEDLEKILFTDEFTVQAQKIGGRNVYWALIDKPPIISPKVSYSKKKMFWASISKKNMGPIVAIDGYLNSEKYIELLQNHLFPFFESE